MHGRCVIRQARKADTAALEAIFQDTFESTWRPNITIEAAAAHIAENPAAAYVADKGGAFWVAESDGVIVGLVHWEDDFVHALHVRGRQARHGFGAKLMDRAETEIAHAGFTTARLETDTFNTASQAFYVARGYSEMGRYPDEEWRSGLTTILFVKSLGTAVQ